MKALQLSSTFLCAIRASNGFSIAKVLIAVHITMFALQSVTHKHTNHNRLVVVSRHVQVQTMLKDSTRNNLTLSRTILMQCLLPSPELVMEPSVCC